ncbi:sensor histidine kinase [Embleya sp. MST-111070]|uniref:sensor histidine kinase n=1 Tax=Embleya sp. MST-111070 TaxID=3398231 RepID=UPI003F740075
MQKIYAWLRVHPLVVDVLYMLPLPLLSASQQNADDAPTGHAWTWTWVVVAVFCLGAVLRRVHPRTAFLVVALGGVGQLFFTGAISAASFAVPMVLYTTAKWGSRRRARIALVAVFVGPGLYFARWGTNLELSLRDGLFGYCFMVTSLGIAWVLGDSMRTRRAYYAELEERAARLEFERDQQAQIAAAAERSRIARELHDVVAHNVSVIVVQADGAGRAIGTAPDKAREALDTIARTGREALVEMRRLLGVLRAENETEGMTPQPNLGHLDDLVAQVGRAGMSVDLTVEGVPVDPSRTVALTAYRIIQEALTNTRKHAGPQATAKVLVRYLEQALELRIGDDGRGAQAPGDGMGHGLIGMRERVAMLDGRLDIGPDPDGGWMVYALLPYGSAGDGEQAAPTPSTPARRAGARTASH